LGEREDKCPLFQFFKTPIHKKNPTPYC